VEIWIIVKVIIKLEKKKETIYDISFKFKLPLSFIKYLNKGLDL